MSSEDYLDKLLREMMEGKVADGSPEPEQKVDKIFTDSPDTIPTDDNSDSVTTPDFSSEIPQNVDSMGLVIDKAPSLSTPENNENVSQDDISELMADIMPSLKSEEALNDDIPNLSDDTSSAFNFDPNKTIEDYINESAASGDMYVESDGNQDVQLGDKQEALQDFPTMPKAPDIPEPSFDNSDITDSSFDSTVSETSFDDLGISETSLDDLGISDSSFDDSVKSEPSFDDADISEIKKELENDFTEADLNSSDFDDEADIEKMIEKARSAQNRQDDNAGFEMSDPSLDELLASDSDSSAADIEKLLKQDENNEAVDEGISALLNGEGGFDSDINALNNPESDGATAPENTSDAKAKKEAAKAEKEALKAEKKRLKEEKKAQKQAEKEAKRKAKADKASKKGNKDQSSDNTVADAQQQSTDFSDIDALLNGADAAAQNDSGAKADGEGAADADDANIFGGGFDSFADFNDNQSDTGDTSNTPENFSDSNPDGLFSEDNSTEEFSEPGTISDVNLFDDGSMDEAGGKGKKGSNKSAGAAGDLSEGDISPDDLPEKDAKKKNPFKSIIDKIKNFLTESDDEDDDEKSEIILSDENAQILDELSQEGDEGGKKKGKKKKAKKDKKGKGGEEDITNPEDLPEKPEKPKKAKKEKKKKNPEEEGKPEKKLPVKKVAAVVFMGIALAAALIVLVNITGNYSVKKSARVAYNSGDYQTCYENLFGKELNESETVMYNQSECILKIRLWYREYEIYEQEGSEVEALDSLIQSVNSYPGLYTSAKEYNCLDKVENEYNKILGVLTDKYGLSEEDAMAIAAIPDDVTYSRIVNAVAKGVAYQDALNAVNGTADDTQTSLDGGDNSDGIQAPLEDKLPEEEGMASNSFIEP